MSERIIVGRDKIGPGGQHVNDGSENRMVVVIDDELDIGVYCATERSQHGNKERARELLVKLKESLSR